MRIAILIGVSLAVLAGCGPTVPKITVNRPWTRELVGAEQLKTGMSMRVEAKGTSDTLLGTEQLLNQYIRKDLERLLVRRGYTIDGTSQTLVLIRYRSERLQTPVTASIGTSSSSLESSASGVRIATRVAMLSVSKVRFEFLHSISIEISSVSGEVIWKGEAVWNSNAYDIREAVTGAMQLLLSGTPSDKFKLPSVSKLKSTHTDNYFDVFCKDTWFSCPATPYRIKFRRPLPVIDPQYVFEHYLNNPEALPAYVDLIQFAETALPCGGLEFESPVNPKLWSKVMLGDRYVFEGSSDTVNVLIDLRGSANGYYPHRCWLATDKEFSEFQDKLLDWQHRVEEYFDMYEH
jgi:hypothetical protein